MHSAELEETCFRHTNVRMAAIRHPVYHPNTPSSVCMILILMLGLFAVSRQVHEREPIAICHHPHRNLVGTIADDNTLKLWRP